MFFERGGHEFFARESAVPGSLLLRMILCVDPVHEFAFPRLEQPGPPRLPLLEAARLTFFTVAGLPGFTVGAALGFFFSVPTERGVPAAHGFLEGKLGLQGLSSTVHAHKDKNNQNPSHAAHLSFPVCENGHVQDSENRASTPMRDQIGGFGGCLGWDRGDAALQS